MDYDPAVEFECEDCHIWTVKIIGGMPPVGKRLCAVCEFIRTQPEKVRAALRKHLHGDPYPDWQVSS